jgi:hypothetical protein
MSPWNKHYGLGVRNLVEYEQPVSEVRSCFELHCDITTAWVLERGHVNDRPDPIPVAMIQSEMRADDNSRLDYSDYALLA